MRELRARRSYKRWTRRSSWLLFTDYQASPEHNSATGAVGESRIVRYQDQGRAFALVEGKQQLEHMPAILAVQVTGGLIGQQNRRTDHEGARQSNALLLAARKLDRIVIAAVWQTHAFEQLAGSLAALGAIAAGQ